MLKILLSGIVFITMVAGCQPEEVIIVPTTPAETALPPQAATSSAPTSIPFERPTALPTTASEAVQAPATATYDLPVTSTLPPITLVFPPTATAQPCVPRADWTSTYTIQAGDNLFGIATRFGVTTAELQTANCLTNANQIFADTDLRVPFTPTEAAPTPG